MPDRDRQDVSTTAPGEDRPETHDELLTRRAGADERMLSRSLARLRSAGELRTFDDEPTSAPDNLLVRAVARIGALEGFTVTPPAAVDLDGPDAVAALARASGVNVRRITLEPGWERHAPSPVLGFRPPAVAGGPAHPVVVLPSSGRRAAMVWDPATERATPLAGDSIAPIALEFFGGLGADDELTYGNVARFTFAGSRREVATILVVALGVGVLGLLTPWVTNLVFGTLVPESESRLVWLVGGALVIAAAVTFSFTIVEGFAVTRMALRAQQRLQPAVWARVLTLPAGFFRQFSSGELAFRVLGADQIRQSVSTSNVGVVLAAAFSTLNLALAFWFDWQLAVAGVAVLLVVLAVTAWFARAIVRETDAIITQGRANNAHISDILEGLAIIRTAGAEKRFFARHAELLRRRVVLQARQQRWAIHLQAFYTGLVAAVPAVFIVVVAAGEWNTGRFTSEVSPTTFLTFVTAFNAVLGAMVALSALIQPLAVAPPTLAAMRPIFEATPEYDPDRPQARNLHGRVELRDVSFRYEGSTSWVLERVSFVAEPGEFVALVGPSGAGKSTVLRVLLGFETPADGAVYYDDDNLADVELAGVRRQLGVVLQSAAPLPGTVRDNVLGGRALTLDDAWRALDAAGLGDDVRAMPMGLQTFVAGDGSSLSGGQLQRLLLARALAARPAVLLLDEATSHLDDVTQRRVTDSIADLGITRIVVAHRLSTVIAADRIVVLRDGRLEEQGTYDELMAAGGLFSTLARRQVV